MEHVAHSTSPHSHIIVRILTVLLMVIGSVALGTYVIAHWIEKQVLTTENWVALVTPLPKEPVVSDALGTYVSKRIFTAVDVERAVSDVLPPRAIILAGPLTSQLETLTTNASKQIVASDSFQTLWSGANRLAMNRLVTRASGEASPLQQRINERFNIDLGGIRGQLGERLGTVTAAIPALQPNSNSTVALAVDLQAKRERLHQIVRSVYYAAAVLPAVSIAALLGALALSRKRRRTTLHITATIITILLLELIAIKVLGQYILGHVQDPGNIPAIEYIYATIIAGLRQMIFVVLGIALLILAICSIFGPTRWARSVRATLHFEQMESSQLARQWQQIRHAIRRRQAVLYIAIAALMLTYMALFLDLSTQSATNTVLTAISSIALVRIISTPPTRQHAG
jgi:hypothetical protein